MQQQATAAMAEKDAQQRKMQQQLEDANRQVQQLRQAQSTSASSQQPQPQATQPLAIADKAEHSRLVNDLKQKDQQIYNFQNNEKLLRARKDEDARAIQQLKAQIAAAPEQHSEIQRLQILLNEAKDQNQQLQKNYDDLVERKSSRAPSVSSRAARIDENNATDTEAKETAHGNADRQVEQVKAQAEASHAAAIQSLQQSQTEATDQLK